MDFSPGYNSGADDGIGIAAQLAILTDKDLKAGKIECLFTVDDGVGYDGAKNLQTGFLRKDFT
jgi:dipeptidase D